jgi:hypothetical protein
MLHRALPRLMILWGIALLALAALDVGGYRAFLLRALAAL